MMRKLSFIPTLALMSILMVAPQGWGAVKQPFVDPLAGPILTIAGLKFRDLDRDGKLSPFEDWRLSADARAKDLVARLSLEEKAGLMMHGTAPAVGPFGMAGVGPAYDLVKARHLIADNHITTYLTRLAIAPKDMALEDNELQAIAAQQRFSIPITLSSDPRSHFEATAGASIAAIGFSQWPETTGLAAINDPRLTRHFGDVIRQEYRAVGIQQSLAPMADLATEPRWPRINGTFGENPDVAGPMVRAYVQGIQGGDTGLKADGVAAVVKHWVGYGASANGYDAHNSYGRFSAFPSGQFQLHIKPFLGAFSAGVAGVMPTYAILKDVSVQGRPLEPVGAGFSHQLLTDMLRNTYAYDGLIISDWAITEDCGEVCKNGFPPGQRPGFEGFSTAWGVEDLSKLDRFAKGVNAGLDQFGGADDPTPLIEAAKLGKVSVDRISQSALRILKVKFELGLFEHPFVDAEAAAKIVGAPAFVQDGRAAQSRALVVLENKGGFLPLQRSGLKVFLVGVSPDAARQYGMTVVADPSKADVAIIRTAAPHEMVHPNFIFGLMQHEGSLAFKADAPDYQAIVTASSVVPTIVSVALDRPAILTNIKDKARALIGDFGASDEAFLDVVTGRVASEGRLPFELPSSMAAVEAQSGDAPHDSNNPLYPIGYGLGLRPARN